MSIIIAFLLGIIIGSFLNVCIYRVPRQESVIFPPSHCPSCSTRLKGIELIPILSYFILAGRCRYCGKQISARYPLIEIITGIAFAFILYKFGMTTETLWYLIIICMLIVITFIDLELKIIPNKIILFGIITGLIINLISPLTSFQGGIIGFFSAGSLFLALAILSRGGMGGGDVKLAAVIGLFLGVKIAMLGLFISFIYGAVISLLLIMTGKKSRKDFVPFGPFMALGTVTSILYGTEIISWYFGNMF